MYHSTAKKHLELVDILFKIAPFKVYPNETIVIPPFHTSFKSRG